MSQDARYLPILNAKIFHERSVGGEHSANLFQGYVAGGLQAGMVQVRGARLLHCTHQFALMRPRLAFQFLNTLLGTLFRTKLFLLDQVVVPVQLFAQIANRPHQFALAGIGFGRHVDRPNHQIHQAARLGLLDITECFFESTRPAHANVHQVFINFELVLEKRDFQLFPAQVSAQHLERLASATVGIISRLVVPCGFLNLATQKLSLEGQHGRFQFA